MKNRLILLIYVLITSSSLWAKCPGLQECVLEFEQINMQTLPPTLPCRRTSLSLHFQPHIIFGKRYSGIESESQQDQHTSQITISIDRDLIEELQSDLKALESGGKDAVLIASSDPESIASQEVTSKNWQLILIGFSDKPQSEVRDDEDRGNLYYGSFVKSPSGYQSLLMLSDADIRPDGLSASRLSQQSTLQLRTETLIDMVKRMARLSNKSDNARLTQWIVNAAKRNSSSLKLSDNFSEENLISAGSLNICGCGNDCLRKHIMRLH